MKTTLILLLAAAAIYALVYFYKKQKVKVGQSGGVPEIPEEDEPTGPPKKEKKI